MRILTFAFLVAMAAPAFLATSSHAQTHNDGVRAYKSEDYDKAWRIWWRLANDDVADSQAWLGHLYHHGLSVQRDFYKAGIWYRAAARQGIRVAQDGLDELRAGLSKLRGRAEKGDPVAQYLLAGHYRAGAIVEQSDLKAIKWLELAAERRLVPAQSLLGFMYITQQKNMMALRWYLTAAHNGSVHSQYMSGLMLKGWRDIPVNRKDARDWLEEAARQGHKQAQKELEKF